MRKTKQPELFVKVVEPFLARDENGLPLREEDEDSGQRSGDFILEPPERIAHLLDWAQDLYMTKDACGTINPSTLSCGELALLKGITQGYNRATDVKMNEPRDKT